LSRDGLKSKLVSMKPSAPPWLDRTDDLSDSDRYARMTPEERFLCFMEVCRLSDAVLAGRPDRRQILAASDPMRAEDEAIWLSLVRESRHAGTDR